MPPACAALACSTRAQAGGVTLRVCCSKLGKMIGRFMWICYFWFKFNIMLIVRNVLIVVLVSLFHWNCGLHYPVMDVGSEYEHFKVEPGKCYFTVHVEDDSFEPPNPYPFILEFVPPKFEEIKVTYTWEELEQYKTYTGEYKIPRQLHHRQYVPGKADLRRTGVSASSHAYQFCYREELPKYWTVSKEKLIANKMTLPLKRPVSEGMLIRKYVKNKPKKLTYNELYCRGGHYTEIREILYPAVCGIQIKHIEAKLKKLDYPVIINNIVDPQDIDALNDFRRKHDIREGNHFSDYETLKALGLY